MTTVGYARVSSVGQNLEVQLEKLSGCDKVFREKRSGVDAGRPELKRCIESGFAAPGLNYPTELTSLADGGLKGPCSKVCYRGRGGVSRDSAPQKLKLGTTGGLLVRD